MTSEILLSERLEKIKNELKKADDITDVKAFLQKYEPFEIDYIQKYSETMLTSFSVRLTYKAIWFAILLFYMSIYLSKYDLFNLNKYVLLALVTGIAIKLLIKDSNEKKMDVYKKIIIAIEEERIMKKMSSEEANHQINE